ncbi:MAG: outer membrane protein assembly factor BamD [Gammaproteobacteria bacterium]
MNKLTIKLSFILLFSFGVVSCSSNSKSPSEIYEGQSAEQIYSTGEIMLAKRSYKDAGQAFEALDSLYPFGTYTQQSQLNLIYAHYESEELPSAEAAAERYIRLYPRSPNADYAYYMKGVANFEQDQSWIARLLPFDLSAPRDHSLLEQAFIDFGDFVRLFPDSRYAPDARQRMVYLRNVFAEREIHIARFYMEKKAYVAAANRATHILRQYSATPQAREALKILVKANQAMGLKQSAQEAQQVLQLNTKA